MEVGGRMEDLETKIPEPAPDNQQPADPAPEEETGPQTGPEDTGSEVQAEGSGTESP